MKSKKLEFSIPYLVISLISLVLLSNLFYGLTKTDECVYISTLFRFLNGDKLLIDDWTGYQMNTPIFFPFIKLFLFFNKTTTGIVLFCRLLHWAFQTIVAFFVYHLFSKTNKKICALFSSLFILLFCKSNIPGISYYSFGFLNIVLSITIIYACIKQICILEIAFFSGIFLAFSTLFNPYSIPFFFVYIIALLFIPRLKSYRKLIFFLVLGILVIAIPYFFIYIKNLSFANINMMLSYWNEKTKINNNTSQLSFLSKTYQYCANIYGNNRIYIYSMIPILLINLLCHKKHYSHNLKIIFTIINIILYITTCFTGPRLETGACYIEFVFFTILNCFIWFKKIDFLIYFLFFIPTLIYSYTFKLSSDQGLYAITIGFNIAMLITPEMNFNIFESQLYSKKIAKFFFYFPILFTLILTFYFRTNNPINSFYKTEKLHPHLFFIPSLHKNITKINNGPISGLWTTSTEKKEYEGILNLINSIDCSNPTTIMVNELCCWIYFVNKNLKPLVPETWTISFNNDKVEMYFSYKNSYPEYVVVLKSDLKKCKNYESTYNSKLLNTKYIRIQENDHAILYRLIDHE